MSYIAAKVEQASNEGGLAVTEEIAVALSHEAAAEDLGLQNGDVVALWSFPARLSQAEAAEYTQMHPPEGMWVISGEWPFELADRYLEEVRRPSRA